MEPGTLFNIIGLLLMGGGITVRTVAARTLGRFYSRTLLLREEHRVVSEGMGPAFPPATSSRFY